MVESLTDRPEETQQPPASEVQITDGEIQSNWDEVHDNFDNMGLAPELLRGVFAYGYVFSIVLPIVSSVHLRFNRVRSCQ